MFTQLNTGEKGSIEVVIFNYLDGYLNARAEQLSQAFHETCPLLSIEEEKLDRTEMSAWLENLRDRQAKGDIRKAESKILGIDVSGNAAIAKVCLGFPKFVFTDYLSLLRIDGHWKIVNKTYSRTELSS